VIVFDGHDAREGDVSVVGKVVTMRLVEKTKRSWG
jgi:hypothetical protein